MKSILKLVIVFICILYSFTAISQTVNTDKLIEDTQKSSDKNNRFRMVWWMPTIFWQASLESSGEMKAAEIDEFVSALDKYTIFIVLDASTKGIGFNFTDGTLLRDSVSFVGLDGKTYQPIDENSIDETTKLILQLMKPVFSNILGRMGENLTFMLFDKTNKKKEDIANPLKEGNITLKVGNEDFIYQLPLASLMPPKKCPVDGAEMKGNWKYCPFHGKELVEVR